MLSSRERLLLAINHNEPDHVPLSFWWAMLKDRIGPFRRLYSNSSNDSLPNQFERIPEELEYGLDPILYMQYPAWMLHSDVKTRTWKEVRPGEECPLLIVEYDTPDGVLRKVVRQTNDWYGGYGIHGLSSPDDVPLWDDYQIPRARTRRYLIESVEDAESFSCLFREPTDEEHEAFVEDAERAKHFADANGLLIADWWSLGLADHVAWICGIENMISASFRNPQLIHRLLDIILEWDAKYLRRNLDVKIGDMVLYRGWYEAPFFPPRTFKIFIAPRLKKLIDLVHSAGSKFCYVATQGIMPLLSILEELGIDVYFGPDPVEAGADLQHMKREVGERICIWGGVNSWVTLGQGTKRQIEDAVREAVHVLGPGGGFVLSAIDALGEPIPWTGIDHMIKVWRKVADYPIQ